MAVYTEVSFAQADAYHRRFPFLSKLTLPQGVADLVRDYPPFDVTVLAPTANLIVRDDLHPALQSLLLQAASEVHGRAGFFQRAGEFPAYKDRLPLWRNGALDTLFAPRDTASMVPNSRLRLVPAGARNR